VLLAAALVTVTGVGATHAQPRCPPTSTFCPPPQQPPPQTQPPPTDTPPPLPPAPTPGPNTGSSGKDVGGYIVGAIVSAFITWVITTKILHDQPPPPPPADFPPLPPPPPPNLPPIAQLPPGPPAPQAPAANQAARALKPSCNLPPPGETRFTNHVVVDMAANTTNAQLDAFAARHTMTRMETMTVRLTGRRLYLWRLDGGGTVESMIRNICNEVAGAQPNYLYELTQAQSEPANSDQYAPAKLNLSEAHKLARGNRILIAVIDSEVDANHPDLAGAIVGSFDASADDERPHSHGTGMAGAIAARHNMLGTAPSVGLLTVRAFSMRANTAEGTTFNILKGLDWAAEKGARIVNMSFAGPADPRLREALEKAYKKGMVLIAAAGNAGPRSPPLYPGADKNVIAVTATDVDDALFSGANRGDYVAVAAPGVDILAPAPEGAYQLTTGTSVATAEVSGVVALLIERNPSLTPADVRRILVSTAKDLGPKGKDRDFGAGLVNALQAVMAAKPR
jgi:subtilisin family serine protease